MYADHERLTFSGVFGSAAAPEEIWECNLNVVPDVGGGIAAMVTDAGLAHAAFVSQLLPFLADDVVLTNTRAAQIGSDGRVKKNTDGAYIQADHPGNDPGSVTGDFHPLQTALVISLVTSRAGSSGRGRFYLPLVKQALDSAHILSVGAATDWADAAALFLAEIRDNVNTPLVASTKGYNTNVTGVRVGRVPDTQRRRRGDLAEGYISTTF